jgi:hypothetical protein
MIRESLFAKGIILGAPVAESQSTEPATILILTKQQ